MIYKPIFNEIEGRPFRWALQGLFFPKLLENPYFAENGFIHYTLKPEAESRDMAMAMPVTEGVDVQMVKRRSIGFLTARYKDFYEDGKYAEVWNDPLNYILTDASTIEDAYDFAEKRIGNYRVGVRRHVTHLGGTISEDELDQLEDNSGTPLTSLPLMPPLPAASFSKPFRSWLLTSDVGYIDYIKAAHNTETTTSRYAYQAKQSTGFKQFIFDAGNSNMKYESSTINSVSKVDIDDVETIVDAAITTATDSDTSTFLPADGEYVIYNIAANTAIRMDSTAGISLEHWNGTTTLGTLDAYINITADGYIDILDSNGNNITMDNTGITIDDGTNTIVINGSTDVTITATNIVLNGTVDVNGDMTVSGTTTHGA